MFGYQSRRSITFLVVVLIWMTTVPVHSHQAADNDDGGSESDNKDYLYHYADAQTVITDYDQDDARPAFLYDGKGARVVEFYAPWCPHCQHFKKHYVEFAKQTLQIVREIAPMSSEVRFYAVSCTKHHELCKNQNIQGYPKIKLYAPGAKGNATAEIPYFKMHVYDVLRTLQIHGNDGEQATPSANSHKTNKKKMTLADPSSTEEKKDVSLSSFWGRRTKQEIFHDAYLSFDFALRNGVFVNSETLPPAKENALKEWLHLLQKTTPVTWNIHKPIHGLLQNFAEIVQSEQQFLQVLDAHPPNHSSRKQQQQQRQWSHACTRDVPGMGYSCGLWTLFHIASVGLVEYNILIDAQDDLLLGEISLNTTRAAETIRNFVEHFFGCDECRVHFLHAYDTCALDRCTRLDGGQHNFEQWRQFPIWLFETHNAVSKRLFHEKVESEKKGGSSTTTIIITQEQEQVHQWPDVSSCPRCWLDQDPRKGWDEENVYKYMRVEYWPADDAAEQLQRDVGAVPTARAPSSEAGELRTMQQPPAGLLYYLALVAAIATVAATWQGKKMKRRRTGLHKKIDLDELC